MREQPIILRDWQVRAVLDGRMTMVRTPISPQPVHLPECYDRVESWIWPPGCEPGEDGIGWGIKATPEKISEAFMAALDCHGGDRLWVRETWTPIPIAKPAGYFTDPKWINRTCWYRADNDRPTWGGRWRSSTSMPRCESRIDLEVTAVRVERLQRISESDCESSGLDRERDGYELDDVTAYLTLRPEFRERWDARYPKFPWSTNPWVLVREFKRVEASVSSAVKS
jgi:hypothetical protein